MNNYNILNINSLKIGYIKNNKVLKIADNLSFSLSSGELTAVVGINGIGKSTLLKTLSCITPKISGNVLLKGRSIEKYKAQDLAKELSLVLTETIPSGNLSVSEVITFGRHPYTNWIGTLDENDKTIIEQVIQRMELGPIRNKKCHELSDGQLQKVMIARALVQDTSLIFLDEPTSHLDLYNRAAILKLLRDICKNTGKTILFSSHEINLALQLCDKILVMLPDSFHFGTPKHLIDSGIFNRIFPEDLIVFDENTASFNVNK